MRSSALAILMLPLVLGGCLERRISITSEPPGALVVLNDVELGVTPLETSFRDFGVYELRVSKPGFEPVVEARTAHAPVWEWPGIDLVTMALPWTIHTRVHWDVSLQPVPQGGTAEGDAAERALLDRANQMRARSGDGADADADPSSDG